MRTANAQNVRLNQFEKMEFMIKKGWTLSASKFKHQKLNMFSYQYQKVVWREQFVFLSSHNTDQNVLWQSGSPLLETRIGFSDQYQKFLENRSVFLPPHNFWS